MSNYQVVYPTVNELRGKNAQWVFDRVANHLLMQGEKSLSTDVVRGIDCMYRGENGTSCAVGCLIPESVYTEDLENIAVGDLEIRSPDTARFLKQHLLLLLELQYVHDICKTSEWRDSLRKVARKRELICNW